MWLKEEAEKLKREQERQRELERQKLEEELR